MSRRRIPKGRVEGSEYGSQVARAFDLQRLRYPRFGHNLKFRYRVTSTGDRCEGFETIPQVQAEVRTRIKHLCAWTSKVSEFPAHNAASALRNEPDALLHARRLIRDLKRSKPSEMAYTFASPLFARRYRLRFYGSISSFVERGHHSCIGLFTLIPQRPGWRVDASKLGKIRPKLLLERFRQQLVRQGLAASDGWVIALIHGEYDSAHDTYQLHLHGVATDGALRVIQSLKRLPAYRRPKTAHDSRKPHHIYEWKGGHRQGSYHLVQMIWPAKPTFINKEGKLQRSRKRRRIPAPRFAEFLMWLDGLTFGDLVLLHGCRISNGELKPTR